MAQLQVSAFQMNDDAILTVKDGDELLTSGVFPVTEVNADTVRIDFGVPAGVVLVKVLERDFDPKKVGVVEGQRRFTWQGVFDVA